MATSGSYILSTTGTELCYTAMQILGQYGADVTTLDSNDQTFALKLLNWYMKNSQYVGGFLWKRKVAFLFINELDTEYTISTTGAHCTEAYQTATVSTDAAASATTLFVDSTTGMLANDTILIPLSTGDYQATTIDTVVSSTELTLADGLDEAIDATARVYTYTTKISKPIRAYKYGLRLYTQGDTSNSYLDRQLNPLAFDDYWCDTPQKVALSQPVSALYIPRRIDGKFYVMGRGFTLQMIAMFTYQEELESITSASQEPDYPSEWFLPLAHKLAYYLSYALEFGPDRRQELNNEAEALFQKVNGSDQETAPLEIKPTGYTR